MGFRQIIFLPAVVALVACDPVMTVVTTAPAVILGAHDQVGKRERWLKRAEQGDVYSQYELAESYCCRPNEGKTDDMEAVNWYCKAAKNGFTRAQIEIGKLYENKRALKGVEVPKNDLMAYLWYRMAARRGIIEAEKLVHNMEDKFTPQEIKSVDILLDHPDMVECVSG